ncbi:MAG: GtrA family protein [Acidobacteriota bacterium]|nr:GtrA family protein [Acidobacteriota bacterium]
MSIWERWLRFNAVGAGGLVLQIVVLALLHRFLPAPVVLETAVAVECAIVHNFVWHVHATWRDRKCESNWLTRLMRFQLSNGMVSLVGNVALMHILVNDLHWPILPSDGIAIAACSILNFGLGDRFVFAAETQ